MHDLETLVEIARNRRTIREKLLGSDTEEATKSRRLFELLSERPDLEEAQIIEKLCYTPKKKYGYHMLRGYLQDHLMELIPFLDYNNDLPANRNEILSCYRQFLSVRILFSLSKRNAAANQARKLLQKVEGLQLLDLKLSLLRFLREVIVPEGKSDRFAEINAEIAKTIESQRVELDIEQQRLSLDIEYSRKSKGDAELAARAGKLLTYIEQCMRSCSLYSISFNRYRVLVMYNDSTDDYTALAKTCNEAISWLECTPAYYSIARKAEFLTYAINASFQQGDFHTAHEHAKSCMELYKIGSMNWILAASHFVLTAICLEDFGAALEKFLKATEHPAFGSIPAFQRERWTTIAGFLTLFVEMEKLSVKNEKIYRAIKRSNFWTEMKVIIKDKRGLNFAVNIIGILFAIAVKDIAEAKRKIILTRKSLSTLGRQVKYTRSEAFLTLVNLHIKSQSVSADEINMALHELSTHTIIEDVEYVPYEQLYGWLKKTLGEKPLFMQLKEKRLIRRNGAQKALG